MGITGSTAATAAPAAPAATAIQRRNNQGVANTNGLGPMPAPRTLAGQYATDPEDDLPTRRTAAAGMGPRRRNVGNGAAAAPLAIQQPPLPTAGAAAAPPASQEPAAGAAGLRGGKRRRNQRKTKRNKSKKNKNKKSNKN